MSSIIIKRNHIFLAVSVVVILLFYFAKTGVVLNYEAIDNKIVNYLISNDFTYDQGWKDLVHVRESFETSLFVLFFLTSIVIIIILIIDYFNHEYLTLQVPVVLGMCLYLGIIFYEPIALMSFSFTPEDVKFSSLIICLPLVFVIFRNSVTGQKVDVTHINKQVKEKVRFNNFDNLKDLLEMGLITKEEFDSKKKKLLREKIEEEIKDSKQYNLLLRSKSNGLLSEEEFDKKLAELISIELHKDS